MKANQLSFLDQILVSGGNFFTLSICAHFLPMADQGKFVYVFSCYLAALLINVSGIFQGAAVKAPQLTSAFKAALAKLQIIQAAILSIFILVVWIVWSTFFNSEMTLFGYFVLGAFLFFQQLADFDRRGAYIFSNPFQAFISSGTLYPIRIIALLILQPDNLNDVLLILVLSTIWPASRTLLFISKGYISRKSGGASEIFEHLKYSKYFLGASLLGWAWSNVPIFFLGFYSGSESAALLASIRGIANVANVLMEQIETRGASKWGREYHQKGSMAIKDAIKKIKFLGVLLWLVVLMITSIFGEQIVLFALGKSYASHWHLLVITWLSYGIYFISRINGIKLRTLGNNQIEFNSGVVGLVVAFLSSVVLIPNFQVNGAAFCYVAIAIALYISQVLSINSAKSI